MLPSLVHDFSHAHIRGVMFGPRREFTLAVSLLVWHQQTGLLTDPAPVRFGGVENLAEVRACFADAPHERSELAWLAYATGRASKPGRLLFELVFERIDLRLVVQCSSLRVGAPGEAADAEPGDAADTGRLVGFLGRVGHSAAGAAELGRSAGESTDGSSRRPPV